MKPRDAAAMLADHRRYQAPTPKKKAMAAPPPSKPKAQAATGANNNNNNSNNSNNNSSSSSSSRQGASTTSKPADATAPPKKNSGAKQSKAAKKKAAALAAAAAAEKEKAAAAAAAEKEKATALAKQQQQQQQRVQLDPDSHKSRNHTLFLAPSGLAPPSWGNRSRKQADALSVAERLHVEILEYAQYTRSTVEDMAVHIEVMIANVRACVQSLWPRSTVETFGSYSTGIWLPSSDVDLVILDVVEADDAAAVTVKNLRRLATALEAQPWVHSLLVLDTAKIPVLKLVSADSTRVPIDITFESSATHSGLIARDLIKRYNEQLPELYPLAVVFKQLLRERDLNDAYTGGLSSYSIVLMLVHFSQLWRNGERCFHAASIYASGSLPPTPAAMAAEAARVAAAPNKATAPGSTPTEVGSPVKLPPAVPTSSYASIVSRSSTSSSSSASEAGRKADSSSCEKTPPVQRFSYAAVAAGIAKVSPAEEEAMAKKAASMPPSSYAAAVAAATGSKASAVATRSSSRAAKPSSASASSGSSAAGSIPGSDAQLDSVSVTSSNADTEDSSSLCSSLSAADSDDESTKRQQQEISERLCLGEHTMLLLEYFGIVFDYRKNGISIRDGGYIYRLAEHGAAVGKPALVIEDPIHPDRNVSASSFAFSKVVAVFEDAFYALKYFRPSKFAPSALSCLLSSSGHSSHASKSSSIAAATTVST